MKTLACCHPLVKIYQHVDDISNLVTGHTPNALVAAAVRYAMHFKELAQQLLLTISQKSMVVPAPPEATLCQNSQQECDPHEGGKARS